MATTTTEPRPAGCVAWRASPHGMGAVAILEIEGACAEATSALLHALAGRDVDVGHVALRNLASVDRGLVVRLSPTRAQLMPHGGTRIVELLAERLVALGARWIDAPLAPDSDVDPLSLYPEAEDRFEALALAACARAGSPRAVPLLLAQPARWRGFDPATIDARDRARAARLDRLVDPPRVALVGRPNAGKSTLSNALLGREGSIASPEPGTTRDAVSTRVDLDGLVVEWLDLPGFRTSTDDPIEREAIALATALLADSERPIDLVVELAAPGIDWPESPRAADARIYAKTDEPAAKGDPARAAADLSISAVTGEGLDELRRMLRARLVPDADLSDPRPWLFDPRLVSRGA